jgi:hypothetical protein
MLKRTRPSEWAVPMRSGMRAAQWQRRGGAPVYIFIGDIPQRADDCGASAQQVLRTAHCIAVACECAVPVPVVTNQGCALIAVSAVDNARPAPIDRRACSTGPLGSYAHARSRAASGMRA